MIEFDVLTRQTAKTVKRKTGMNKQSLTSQNRSFQRKTRECVMKACYYTNVTTTGSANISTLLPGHTVY